MKLLSYQKLEDGFHITDIWDRILGIQFLDVVCGIQVYSSSSPVLEVGTYICLPTKSIGSKVVTNTDDFETERILSFLSKQDVETEGDLSWVTLERRTIYYNLDQSKRRRVLQDHRISFRGGVIVSWAHHREEILKAFLSTTIEEQFYQETGVEI